MKGFERRDFRLMFECSEEENAKKMALSSAEKKERKIKKERNTKWRRNIFQICDRLA